MNGPLSDAERAQVIDLYGTGLTLRQVADRIRRSKDAVRRALVDAGIPRRPATRPTTADAERDVIVHLYTVDQLSTWQIADRLGRAQSHIWKILADAGVPRRRAGWPKDARTRRRDRAGAA